MVYADSRSTQKEYDHYYSAFSKYEDVKTGSGGGYSLAERKRLAETAALIGRHLQSSDSILDIGCANGGLLEAFAAQGFHSTTGIDPSPASIRQVRARGFNGHSMNIADLDPNRVGMHKALVLSHVLEHVFDVAATMRKLKALLREDGLLYIEVPDAARYLQRYVVPYYYFDAEHINHFDRPALQNLAAQHGFEVLGSGEKDIAIPGSIEYPAIYAILKKTAEASPPNIRYSDALEAGIVRYVEKSANDGSLDKISEYASTGVAVILWGAGSHTQRLLATTRLSECNIVAVVDNDQKKQGLHIGAHLIESPGSIRHREGVIFISAAVYAREIAKEIAAMGLLNKIEILG